MSRPFVVEYRWSDAGAGHHQVWEGAACVSWESGGHPDADVSVTRTRTDDLADHDAGTPADPGPRGAPLIEVRGEAVDLLGWTGPIRKDLDGWRVDGPISVRLRVDDAPFGPHRGTLRWLDGALHPCSDDDPVTLGITMGYTDAIDWLWGDLIVGHLLHRSGQTMISDVVALSAVEGLVSAPTIEPPPPAIASALAALARTRSDGATAEREPPWR